MEDKLLEKMLDASSKDNPTTAQGGAATDEPLPHGMRFHRTAPRRDARGHLIEMFDRRWDFHHDAYDQGYLTTILPHVVKGWALHKTHEDRYFVVSGVMELVVFDPRPNSPTLGKLFRIVLSGHEPRIVNIPAYVWHADHNIGVEEVMLMNFPTRPYNHADPDKYRLPIDTPLIPHKFEGVRGW